MNDNTSNRFLELSEVVLEGDLFKKVPESHHSFAPQWCACPKRTLEESANCFPMCAESPYVLSPYVLKDDYHQLLDDEVLNNENMIRQPLNKNPKQRDVRNTSLTPTLALQRTVVD